MWLQVGKRINKAEAAAYFSVTENTVGKWIKAGMPAEKVDGRWEIDQTARLKKAQAEKAEIEVEVLRGSLLPADEVERAWADHIVAARAKLLGMSSKLAQQLSSMFGGDVGEIEDRIEDEVEEALGELGSLSPGDFGGNGEGGKKVDAASETNGKRVGRPKPDSGKRKQRRTRKVAD